MNSCSKPDWPKDALAARRAGTVTMALLVGVDGKVKNSRITQSSGRTDLDEAARIGISKCTFVAGRMEGRLVEAWMLFQYVWNVD